MRDNRPQTLGEKVIWLKDHYRNPLMPILADKYAARQYIAEKGAERYLVPLLGVYDSVREIDVDKLPDQFILKCNHGYACNIMVKDKSKLDWEGAKRQLEKWMASDFSKVHGEWWYGEIPRKIVCEELLQNENGQLIHDHKIFMMNGSPKYIHIIVRRGKAETTHTFFWLHGEQILVQRAKYSWETEIDISRASSWLLWDEMVEIATQIVPEEIPLVRLDFLVCNNRIYTGEFTFMPSAGKFYYTPEEYNTIFGDMLELPGLEQRKGGAS